MPHRIQLNDRKLMNLSYSFFNSESGSGIISVETNGLYESLGCLLYFSEIYSLTLALFSSSYCKNCLKYSKT